MFHLAGIPTYLLVAELAINQVLYGELPRVASYPAALSESASSEWAARAALHLGYAENNYLRTLQCVGLVTVAVTEYAHALAALRGQWVTNEKRLLDQTGLSEVNRLMSLAPLELMAGVRKLSALREAVNAVKAPLTSTTSGAPAERLFLALRLTGLAVSGCRRP